MPSKDRLLGAPSRNVGPRPVTGHQQVLNSASLPQGMSQNLSHQNLAPHVPVSSQSQQPHTGSISSQQQSYPAPARPLMPRSSGSAEALHTRSGSSSSMRSSVSVPGTLPQNTPTTSTTTHCHTTNMGTPSNVPLDAYGTLPRNRKNRRTSDPTGNSEVYQMYLHRQKSNNIQQKAGSGSDASRESDSSSCESSGGDSNPQRKSSKAEIKELLQANTVQRQKQQFAQCGPQQEQFEAPNLNPNPSDLRQRPNHDIGNSGDTSGGDGGQRFWRGQPIQQVESGSRLSHSSQGSTISASSQDLGSYQQFTAQSGQQQHQQTHNKQSSPGHQQLLKSTPGVGSAFSSPPRSQGNRQPSQQQQNQYHQQTCPQRPPSRPSSSQGKVNVDFMSSNTSQHQQPQPQTVSGYTQPLPGQRPYSHHQNHQGPPGSSSQTYTQVYPPQTNRQIMQSNNIQQSRGVDNTNTGHSMANNSYTYNNNNNNFVNSKIQQPTNLQNLNQGINNLNLNNRKSHNGGPPPPPTRTTSNPDFSQNIRKLSSTPTPSSNIARVQPNGHLNSSQPGRVSSPFHADSIPPPPPPSRHAPQVTQLKHATSTTGLNCFPQTTLMRPLERCSSQPDVQHLGLSYTGTKIL